MVYGSWTQLLSEHGWTKNHPITVNSGRQFYCPNPPKPKHPDDIQDLKQGLAHNIKEETEKCKNVSDFILSTTDRCKSLEPLGNLEDGW